MHTRCDWGSPLCTALLLPRLGSDSQAPITNADWLVLQASPVGDYRARCSHSAGRSSGAEVEEAQKHQAVARPTVQLQVSINVACTCPTPYTNEATPKEFENLQYSTEKV